MPVGMGFGGASPGGSRGWLMNHDPNKMRVLVSYSPGPIGNARFAEGLADSLRKVGFEVGLHEWRAAAAPASGIISRGEAAGARHGLIIVTRDWLENPGLGAEAEILAGHPAEAHRLVAIRRDRVDESLLANRFPGLNSVEWLPDDPQPDARFWEVYSALTGSPAGDRSDWADQGRRLLGRSTPAPGRSDEAEEDTAFQVCPSRPVLVLRARGWTLVLCDSGHCFRVGSTERPALHTLPDLDGCSALAVDAEGTLFVGFYEGMLATPRDCEWAYHAADAPVMCLAATVRDLAFGDAAGWITFRDRGMNTDDKAYVGEPLAEMIACEAEVAVLGTRGGLWWIRRPEGGPISLAPVRQSESLGRPVGLFDAGAPSRVGVFSEERCALLWRGRHSLSVGVRRFPDGINKVAHFGARPGVSDDPPLGILTDQGQVWVAGADLKSAASVEIPGSAAEVVGLAPGPAGWLLAWTEVGDLVAIGRDRSVRPLATGHVALAYAEPELPGGVAAVHWRPECGVRVRRLSLEPSR